jgi:DNA-binding transcriptional ArsR family regulator
MPKYGGIDETFRALADPTRRAMVERLSRGPASMSELARPFEMALPSILQHLGVLEAAGVVTSTKVGRVRTYQLAVGGLGGAAAWIADHHLVAEKRLDRLGQHLTKKSKDKETPT